MLLLIQIVFFVGVLVLILVLRGRRRRGLERAAQEMGFSYEANPAVPETEGFLELPLLKRNTGLSHLMRGSTGTGEVVIVDVRTGSGKGATLRTVALHRLARKRLPVFELRPEHFLDKIGSALGFKDINFESNPEFSKRYKLQGADEAAVRELFHAGRLAFFEQQKGWSVEGAGEWLAVYRQVTCVAPGKLRTFLEETGRVVTAFD
ncbi:MAG: hypothetical protein ACRD5I_00640 [Candidatus Acidiferrales bacterium]